MHQARRAHCVQVKWLGAAAVGRAVNSRACDRRQVGAAKHACLLATPIAFTIAFLAAASVASTAAAGNAVTSRGRRLVRRAMTAWAGGGRRRGGAGGEANGRAVCSQGINREMSLEN